MKIEVPVIPESAPFTLEQRAWLNGYLAGLFARGQVSPVAAAADPGLSAAARPAPLQPLTILFGSQTGTAEGLAKRAAKAAGKRGFAATVLDMAQADLGRLATERNVLVITSTYGEGEPPDNAKAMHESLRSQASLPESGRLMGSVRYSLCALGDTNYVHFCQCGQEIDAWLEKLGAHRVHPRVDCDVDYESAFAAWLDAALAALGSLETAPAAAIAAPAAPVGEAVAAIVDRGSPGSSIPATVETAPAAAASVFNRSNPYSAPVLAVRGLNGAGSAKEVNHVEISLEGSDLQYSAGDALGIVPQNCPALVDDVLALLGCDGEEAVSSPLGEIPLRRALTECYDLGRPTTEMLAVLGPVVAGVSDPGKATGSATPASLPHHVVDVLLQARTDNPNSRILTPADFVARLKRIQPRLYSISSSPRAHPGQVHLTVGAVRYEKDARARKGVCSTFLAERAIAAGRVGVFVHANRSFRPPADGNVPMIMVGPGTGIAPFRAFLEERAATGAQGRNWLFFGDQRADCDFLYRDEINAWRASGLLTRLDLAFSRDQAEKIYVQHRMLAQAAELFAWLEAGAHFYVCGDASRMAKDVDAALHRVIEQAGNRSPEDAAAYVQSLKSAKRYARDVY